MPSKSPYTVKFKPILARTDKPLIDPVALERELREVSAEWAEEFIDEIKEYPPPKKHGSYVRTGRLGANWRAVTTKELHGLVTRIVNAVRDPKTGAYYMQRVQGIKQIPMHRRTGWKNVWGAMRRFGSSNFKNRVQKAIDAHIRRRRL